MNCDAVIDLLTTKDDACTMNACISDSSSDDEEAPDLVLFPTSADSHQPLDETPPPGATRTNANTSTTELPSPLPPVPVTILTGFLGSGKTTLIRHILSSPDHGYRIAVIENEFGGGSSADDTTLDATDATLAERAGLNVESMIARDGVTGSSLSDLIELPNGCVCCTVKDSLVETLEILIEKKTDIDYILIEASGMANPGPIASVFWLDDALESRLRLDGVVACVDCLNILMQLKETSSQSHSSHEASEGGGGGGGEEAAQQIAYADRILLNKTDLLLSNTDGASASYPRKTTHTLECVLEEIHSINPTAPVHATTFSKVPDLAWILDAKCFDAERVKDIGDTFALGDIGNDEDDNSDHVGTDAHCSDAGHDHDHSHHHQHEHRHTTSVSTTALIQIGSVDLRRVHTWLASLLWPDQDEDDAVLTARLQQLMQQEEQEAGTALGSTTGTGNDMANNEMRIFRIKGILSVQHPCDESSVPFDDEEVDNTNGNNVDSNWLDHRRYIVQGVNDLWEIHPGSDSLRYSDGEERICKLIFIGRCLDRAKLLAGFEKCFC